MAAPSESLPSDIPRRDETETGPSSTARVTAAPLVYRRVVVLGGGAMGTACAAILAEKPGVDVMLWFREEQKARETARTRINPRLAGFPPLPNHVDITADRERAAEADLLVAAVPTSYLRETLQPFRSVVGPHVPVVSVVKGIENSSFARPSEILCETLGPRPVLALCGPSHAEELMRRLPASVVVAHPDKALGATVQTQFATDRFRVYTSTDLPGVEFAGAMKNVMAIAAGICDGLGYGDNAKAALLTRGITEMVRFGTRFGALPDTFAGLAGIGDLITTCFSPFGRNRRVGERLGRGVPLSQILAELPGVAEGVPTCRSLHDIAVKQNIPMPITSSVFSILFEGQTAAAATQALMQRPLGEESLTS